MLIYSERKLAASRTIEKVLSLFRPVLLRSGQPAPALPEDPVIVLIEPFQMGDVLSLAVMIDPILARYPAARIVIWCHTKNAHVYAEDPRIWKVAHARMPWSNRGSKRGTFAEWATVVRSGREVRSFQPHAAIDTRGDIRSQALLYLAGCDWRIGYTTYVGSNLTLRGTLLTHPIGTPPDTHRYRTNLYAMQPLLGRVPELHLPAFAAPAGSTSMDGSEGKIVVLHPGAGWRYKQWPIDRWIALIVRLQTIPSIRLIQIVGPGETELAEELSRGLPQPLETRATSYKELLTLLSHASLFLCLDSGPMNAATLMNIPVIGLFGPGESNVWAPLSDGSRFFHHIEDYPCHPCTQSVCVRPNDSCMTTIQTDEVFEAARTILGIPPPALRVL